MTHHTLRDVPLFAELADTVLEELDRASRTRAYPAGQVLWSEGDPGDSLLILETGQIRVCRITPAGQEVVLAVLEPPACLGELALIDGAPRDATVMAQRAISVRLIPRLAFLHVMNTEPSMMTGLVRSLVAMVRAANTRHARMVGLDVPGRLAAWLLERAGTGADAAIVHLGGRSQTELAAELSTTRSTLNRALKDFEDLGLISVRADQVTVVNGQALALYTT